MIQSRLLFLVHLLAAGRVYLSEKRVTAPDCGLLPHSFHHFLSDPLVLT